MPFSFDNAAIGADLGGALGNLVGGGDGGEGGGFSSVLSNALRQIHRKKSFAALMDKAHATGMSRSDMYNTPEAAGVVGEGAALSGGTGAFNDEMSAALAHAKAQEDARQFGVKTAEDTRQFNDREAREKAEFGYSSLLGAARHERGGLGLLGLKPSELENYPATSKLYYLDGNRRKFQGSQETDWLKYLLKQ